MAMVVKNNMSAISTLNTLNRNSSALAKSLEKVSSGMKINGAADDASGYAISERMRVQIRSLDQANQNTQNGNSMMKTAEGAVSSTVEILKTLKEKVINAANDTNTDSDRQTIQKELNQSIDQIDDNANITYNGKYLVDGSKNTIGKATFTSMSNQALSTDTKATTALTDLKARSGDDLSLSSTDKVTVSYVQAGKTYSTTFQVGTNNLQDIFKYAEAIDPNSEIFDHGANTSMSLAGGGSTAVANALTSMNAQVNAALSGGTAAEALSTTAFSVAAALSGSKDMLSAVIREYNSTTAGDKLFRGAEFTAYNAMEAVDMPSGQTLAANASNVANSATAIGVEDALRFIADVANSAAGATSLSNAAVVTALSDAAGKLGYTSTEISAMTAAIAAATTAAHNMSTSNAGLITAGHGASEALIAYMNNKATYDKETAKLLEGNKIGEQASGDLVSTASGQNAITITAANDGIHGQISGLNISVTDSEGNVKKSANAALDAFDETIRAQNKSEDNAITLQVGAKANQSIKVGLTDMRSEALGLKGSDGTKLNISTQTKANAAINVLDNAIQKALDQQTTIGSIESRLSYTSSNLTTASENVQASESAIRDADMAKEMTNYTKNNVLLQAAQSMLAQANQNSSAVLSLLQ